MMRIKRNLVTYPKVWKDRVVLLFISGRKIMKIKKLLIQRRRYRCAGFDKRREKRESGKQRTKKKNMLSHHKIPIVGTQGGEVPCFSPSRSIV